MGNAVTIHGANFSGVGFERGPSSIHLGPTNGPTNVTHIVLVDSATITCVLPNRDPSWPASVALWITTPLGVGVHHDVFKFNVPVPMVVNSISPSTGDRRGGTPVTIRGKGFTGAIGAALDCFGELSTIADFTVANDRTITGTTTAGTQFAPYGVRVFGADGQEATLHVNDLHPVWAFIDTTPAFVIDSVTPDHGTIMGNTLLTVRGQMLSLVQAIQWEGLTPPPAGGAFIDETEFTTPSLDYATDGLGIPGYPGTNVIWFYTGIPYASYGWTYDPFRAATLSLNEVGVGGGETVSIYGTSLDYATILEVGGVGQAFTVVSEHEITFVTPGHAAGTVAVHLEGADLGYGVLTTDINITFA